MLQGHEVWEKAILNDMEYRSLDGRRMWTFRDMRENFYEILKDSTSRNPEKTAFCDNWNREYSYGTFLRMVDDFAYELNRRNMKKGSHVGILLHNSIEFCVAFFAVCKIGAVAVPFPSKYREPELRMLMDKADLDILICSENFESWVSTISRFQVLYSREEEKRYGFAWMNLTEAPEMLSAGALTDEIIIMFTSGTTSASKGVVLKNYNIIHAAGIYQRICGITPEDKTVIPVPIYHITGLIALLGLFVYAGATVYLYRRYDAERVLSCVRDQKITFMHGSPTVFGLMLDKKEQFPELPSLRMILCGSSYLPVAVLQKLHKWLKYTEIRNVYGMTETSSPGTLFDRDSALSLYPNSEGKPVPGVEIRICDDKGRELPEGEIGTVYLRGANICRYYYHMDSPLITADGWLNTGDMGRINSDHYVFIVDRRKDMINRGGEKIWCTDVEDELVRIHGIKDAAVVGIASEKYGEEPAALLVSEDDIWLSPEEIRLALMPKLARYKIPVQYLWAKEIPKTPGLKTDKRKIREWFREGIVHDDLKG